MFNGERLRNLRKSRAMTIEALAERSGVSSGLISQVERGRVSPTMDSFWKLCQALDVPLHFFFDPAPGNFMVVRRDERRILSFPSSHISYQLLSPNLDGKLEMVQVVLDPGDRSDELIAHEGEECGLMLSGSMSVLIGDQEIHLEEGDSISFKCTTPHRFVNTGSVKAVSVWAITPPSF